MSTLQEPMHAANAVRAELPSESNNGTECQSDIMDMIQTETKETKVIKISGKSAVCSIL